MIFLEPPGRCTSPLQCDGLVAPSSCSALHCIALSRISKKGGVTNWRESTVDDADWMSVKLSSSASSCEQLIATQSAAAVMGADLTSLKCHEMRVWVRNPKSAMHFGVPYLVGSPFSSFSPQKSSQTLPQTASVAERVWHQKSKQLSAEKFGMDARSAARRALPQARPEVTFVQRMQQPQSQISDDQCRHERQGTGDVFRCCIF